MSEKKEKENGFDDGSFVVKKSRKFDIIAFIVCLLVAFAIWIYAEGRPNTTADSADNADSSVQTEAADDAE